jgi:hypothetical protein
MTAESSEKPKDMGNRLWEQTVQACFTSWMGLYETLVAKHLRAPQLGLFREHLHEALGATDAFNQFAAALAAFAQHFGQPFQQAVAQFGQTIATADPPINSAGKAYDAFVAVLAEKTEAFLGSPEGVDGVAAIIDGYLAFKTRMDGAVAPWLRFFAIPGKQEMADVHRQLHGLKKHNRLQQVALDQQAALIQNLQQRINKLEKPDGKPALQTPSASRRAGVGRKRRPSAEKPDQAPGPGRG